MPLILLSRMARRCSQGAALFTWYGSSVMTMLPGRLSFLDGCRARIWIMPRPVRCAWRIPSYPWINPAVGKSGPLMAVSARGS